MNHSHFKRFVKTKLKETIFRKYLSHKICSESDLQCYTWQAIRRFVRRRNSGNTFLILNRCYFKRYHAYPDISIFRGKPPNHSLWAAIELKEVKELKPSTVASELKLLRKYKRSGCERAYLIFVARSGGRITKRKGLNAYYYTEVPIVLQNEIRRRKLKVNFSNWETKFKQVKVFAH